MSRRVLAVLLENEPGALSRVVGLFAQRNYNIETLTVAPTEDATLSRVTLSTDGSDEKIEQITKHLNRLVDVVKVLDLHEAACVERELMFVKINAQGPDRAEVKRTCDIFRGPDRRCDRHRLHRAVDRGKQEARCLHSRPGPLRNH